MNEMRQVIRTVVTVAGAFLLLTLPQALGSEDNGLARSLARPGTLTSAFNQLMSKALSSLNDMSFNMRLTDHINLRVHFHKSNANSGGKRKPNHIDIEFNKSKISLDKNVLARKLRRRKRRILPNGMQNPYRYFPLKGEDI